MSERQLCVTSFTLTVAIVSTVDTVGHNLEALDRNVFNLVLNELEDQPLRKFKCSAAPILDVNY